MLVKGGPGVNANYVPAWIIYQYNKDKNNDIAFYRVDSIRGKLFCINITTTLSTYSSKRNTYVNRKWNYVPHPKFQRPCLWSFCNECNYLFVLVFKLTHDSGRGAWCLIRKENHTDASLYFKYLEYFCSSILTGNYLQNFKCDFKLLFPLGWKGNMDGFKC